MDQFLQQSYIKQEYDHKDRDTNPHSVCVQCKVFYTTNQELIDHNIMKDEATTYLKFEESVKIETKGSTIFDDFQDLHCVPCNTNFTTKSKLKEHRHYAHGVLSQCKECGEVCKSKKKLQQHTWTKHEVLQSCNAHFCEKCGVGFYGVWRMKRHMESCGRSRKGVKKKEQELF